MIHGATWAWIMCTHDFESLISFAQILLFYFFPPSWKSVENGADKRCSWVRVGMWISNIYVHVTHRDAGVTKRAGWKLPPVSAFCLHLFYGLCFWAASNCICSCVIVCYRTHSSVCAPWVPGDRRRHYTAEITGHFCTWAQKGDLSGACYDAKTTVSYSLFASHLGKMCNPPPKKKPQKPK